MIRLGYNLLYFGAFHTPLEVFFGNFGGRGHYCSDLSCLIIILWYNARYL